MRVVLTVRAEADIDEIAAYIQARNPEAARRVEAAIQAAFRLIATYPFVGRELRPRVRRLVLPRYPYSIYCRVHERLDEVHVFAVRHGARRELR